MQLRGDCIAVSKCIQGILHRFENIVVVTCGYRHKAALHTFACFYIIPNVLFFRAALIAADCASRNVHLVVLRQQVACVVWDHIAKQIPAGAFLTVSLDSGRHSSFIAIVSAIRL